MDTVERKYIASMKNIENGISGYSSIENHMFKTNWEGKKPIATYRESIKHI